MMRESLMSSRVWLRKITVNPLGYGLGATADGLGSCKHYFADAQAGQVGFFGAITSNNPASPNAMVQMNCSAQFDTGFSPFIREVRGRRFTVVDEQRGLVFTQLTFDHAGTDKEVQRTIGTVAKVGTPFDTPYTFLIHELFRIKDGRIAQVEAVVLTTPQGMPSGW
ncbi:MAG: hypothetical protein ABI859_19140 [Pseudomonadota bacterium]